MTELSLYWDLADAAPFKRMGAALKLADSLKEATGKESSSSDSSEKPLIRIKNSVHQYAINRLVRGLTSFNDCARQGFCLALQLALEAVPTIDRTAVLNGINYMCSNAEGKGIDDQKDKAAARIFGCMAIQRTGYFQNRASLPQLTSTVEGLWAVFDSRTILREACTSVILAIVRDAATHSAVIAVRLLAQRVKAFITSLQAWSPPRKLEVTSSQGKKNKKADSEAGLNRTVIGALDLSLFWLTLQVQSSLYEAAPTELQELKKFSLSSCIEGAAYTLVHANAPIAPRLHSVWNTIAERVAAGDEGAVDVFIRAAKEIHVNKLLDNTEEQEETIGGNNGTLSPERIVIVVRAFAVIVRSCAFSNNADVLTSKIIPNISELLEITLRSANQATSVVRSAVVRALHEVTEAFNFASQTPSTLVSLPTLRTPPAINAQFQKVNEQELNVRYALTHPETTAADAAATSTMKIALFKAFTSASANLPAGTTRRAVTQIASLLSGVEGKLLKTLADEFAEIVKSSAAASQRRAAASWLVQLPFVADGHKADPGILSIAAEALREFAHSAEENVEEEEAEEEEEEYNPDEDDDDEEVVDKKANERAAKAAEKAAKGTSKASYFSMLARAVRSVAIRLDKASGKTAEVKSEALKNCKKIVEVLSKEAKTRDDDEKDDSLLLIQAAENAIKLSAKNSQVSSSETGSMYAAAALLLATVAATDLPSLRPEPEAKDEAEDDSDVELDLDIDEEEDMKSGDEDEEESSADEEEEKDEEDDEDGIDIEDEEDMDEVGMTATALLLAEISLNDDEKPLLSRLASALPSILLGDVTPDATRSGVESIWDHCLAACVDADIVLSLAAACGADVLENGNGEDDEDESGDEDEEQNSAVKGKKAAKKAAAAVDSDSDSDDEEEQADSDDEDDKDSDDDAVPASEGASDDEDDEEDEDEELISISENDLFSALTEDDVIPAMPVHLSQKNKKRADMMDVDRKDAETRLRAVTVTEPVFNIRNLQKASKLRQEKISGVPPAIDASPENGSVLLTLGDMGVAVHAALLLSHHANQNVKSLRESASRRLMHILNNAISATSDAEIKAAAAHADEEAIHQLSESAAKLAVSFPQSKQLSGPQRAQLVKATANLLKFASIVEESTGFARLDEGSVCGAGCLPAVISDWLGENNRRSRVPAELIREVNSRHGDILARRVDFAALLDRAIEGKITSKFLIRELLVALTSLYAKVTDRAEFEAKVAAKMRTLGEQCIVLCEKKEEKTGGDVEMKGTDELAPKKHVKREFANTKQKKQFRDAAVRAIAILKKKSN